MGDTVEYYEAKTHLAQLLERVAKGERITITRHGVPIAILVPAPGTEQPDILAAIARLKALRARRKGRSYSASAIRELIEEGRP
jgi:prevent-host-death family protein